MGLKQVGIELIARGEASFMAAINASEKAIARFGNAGEEVSRDLSKMGRSATLAAASTEILDKATGAAGRAADNLADQLADVNRELGQTSRGAIAAAGSLAMLSATSGVGALGKTAGSLKSVSNGLLGVGSASAAAAGKLALVGSIIGGVGVLGGAAGAGAIAASMLAVQGAAVAATGAVLAFGVAFNVLDEAAPIKKDLDETTKALEKLKEQGVNGGWEFDKLTSKLSDLQAEYDSTFMGMIATTAKFGREASKEISKPIFDGLKVGLSGVVKLIQSPAVQNAVPRLAGIVEKAVGSMTASFRKVAPSIDWDTAINTRLDNLARGVSNFTTAFDKALPQLIAWGKAIGTLASILAGPVKVGMALFFKGFSDIDALSGGFQDKLGRVSIVFEFLGQVMAAASTIVSNLVSGFAMGLGPTLERLNKSFEGVIGGAGGFDKVLEKVGEIVGKIGVSLGGFIGAVIELGVTVVDLLGKIGFFDAVVVVFDRARDAVLTFASALRGDWIDAGSEKIGFLDRVFGILGLTIRDLATAFSNLFAGKFDAGFDALGSAVGRVAGFILEAIPKILMALGKIVASIVQYVVNKAPEILAQLKEWGVKFVEWIGPQIPKILSELGRFAASVFNWIGGQAVKFVEGLATWGKEFWAWISPRIPGMLEELGKIAGAVTGWIIKQIPKIVEQLVKWSFAFLDWIVTDVIPKLPGILAGIWNAIAAWAGEVFASLGEALKPWTNAIITTVSGWADAVGLPLAEWQSRFQGSLKAIGDYFSGPEMDGWKAQFQASLAGIGMEIGKALDDWGYRFRGSLKVIGEEFQPVLNDWKTRFQGSLKFIGDLWSTGEMSSGSTAWKQGITGLIVSINELDASLKPLSTNVAAYTDSVDRMNMAHANAAAPLDVFGSRVMTYGPGLSGYADSVDRLTLRTKDFTLALDGSIKPMEDYIDAVNRGGMGTNDLSNGYGRFSSTDAPVFVLALAGVTLNVEAAQQKLNYLNNELDRLKNASNAAAAAMNANKKMLSDLDGIVAGMGPKVNGLWKEYSTLDEKLASGAITQGQFNKLSQEYTDKLVNLDPKMGKIISAHDFYSKELDKNSKAYQDNILKIAEKDRAVASGEATLAQTIEQHNTLSKNLRMAGESTRVLGVTTTTTSNQVGIGSSTMQLALAGIEKSFTLVSGTAKTEMGNVGKTVAETDLSGPGNDIGKSLMDGIVAGIQNNVQAAANAAASAAERVSGAASTKFLMASPSKVFAYIGQMLMEGLALGIDDNADKPVGSVEDATRSVGDSAIKTLTEQADLLTKIASATGALVGSLSGIKGLGTVGREVIAAFNRDTLDLTTGFYNSSKFFNEGMLKATDLYAETLSKVGQGASAAFGFLTNLPGYVTAGVQSIASFNQDALDLAAGMYNSSTLFNEGMLKATNLYVETLSKIGPGASAAFSLLQGLPDRVVVGKQAIDSFGQDLSDLVTRLYDIAKYYSEDMLRPLAAFGEANGKLFGGLKDSVSVFDLLRPYTNVPSQAMTAFRDDIEITVKMAGDLATKTGTELLAKVAAFGVAIGQLFTGMKAPMDVMTGLRSDTFAKQPSMTMQAFVDEIGLTVTLAGDMAARTDKDLLGKAQDFATAVDKIFSKLKSALDIFKSLESLKDNPAGALGKILEGIGAAIERMAGLNSQATVYLSGAQTFANTMQRANQLIAEGLAGVGNVPGAPSASPGEPAIPGMADGGTTDKSGLFRVGERGPELLWLPKGASVMDAITSARVMDTLANNFAPMTTPPASASQIYNQQQIYNNQQQANSTSNTNNYNLSVNSTRSTESVAMDFWQMYAKA